MKNISFFLLFVSGLLFVQSVCAGDTNSVAQLQQQVQKLRAENEALKQENQVLQKLVLEKQNPAQGTVQSQATSGLAPKPAIQKGYWITTSSSKRHNSSCRYYGNSKGRLCGPDEGIPCKICGG